MTEGIINIYNTNFKRERVKEITREVFVELVFEQKISLYRVAKGILKHEQDVEDVVSETIFKAFKNLSKLQDKKNFKAWIMRILINECYRTYNKGKRVELQENMEKYNLSYEDAYEGYMINYINKLDKDSQIILTLFYYEDMSISEISKILNVSEGTVKSRLSRSKKKLKIILEDSDWSDLDE
ncbi:RNA polymerase sigma factor [Clostridium sp. 'White wine YQ']|uniref:RNA polymerase sigma factor n=1 Tax=Clostridium sp. 'White wine YQ' TaxID=3027474 RepID=UPI0023653144|nr:sigma-70 family RNA polymerase sigma factor [Clostridium sp. 'White wine YQ']MDD7794178.1 sigma-70 family RNA polymerase sigma factor [Clostridium sp. 'White wine YQ']